MNKHILYLLLFYSLQLSSLDNSYKNINHHLEGIKNILIINIPDLISGGPEALCQLFYELKNIGFNVKILWISDKTLRKEKRENKTWYLLHEGHSQGTPFYQKKYGAQYLDFDLILDKSTLIVLPEVCSHMISFFKEAYVGFYWLSINNFCYKDSQPHKDLLFNNSSEYLIHLSDAPWISKELQKWGLPSYLLEAPISDHYLSTPITKNKLENTIIYNPAKWEHLANAFINLYPSYQFTPLRNLDQQGVIDALDSAKIYIDFGYFPGKDRIPREALARNCVIFVHNYACGSDFDSFPVDNYFRFSEEEITNGILNDKISYTLQNYEEMYNKQAYAKNVVHNEGEKFKEQIKNLFSPSNN